VLNRSWSTQTQGLQRGEDALSPYFRVTFQKNPPVFCGSFAGRDKWRQMNTEWRRCVGRLVSILPSHIFKIALQYLVALLWSRKETCNLRHQRMHLRHPVEIFRLARGWKDVQRRKKTLNLKEPYNLWARVFCGNVLTIQVSSNCRNRDVIVSKSQACKPVKQSSDPQNAGEKICRPAKLVDC